MILADITSPEWPQTVTTLIGIVGLLAITVLIFTVILQAKKLFGRNPPMGDELDKRDKALRKMIFASENNLKERITAVREEARVRLVALEEHYEEMQIDRERKWGELKSEYSELRETLAFIRGKFEQDQP